jgi:hypothetical protein
MASVAGKPSVARDSTHSGRLLLRMPQTLHAQLAARSDAEGVSLNQYIVEALTRTLTNASEATDTAARPVPRSLRLSLVANAIVVALAAATCVALLVVALR